MFVAGAKSASGGFNKVRNPLWFISALILALGLTAFAPQQVHADGGHLVLAFYYAWFDEKSWSLDRLPDLPLEPYVSRDPAVMARHLAQARQAGIDAFVVSWYGPQVQDNQTETNLATLLRLAAEAGMQVTADLEVTSPFIHSEADVVAALKHLLTVHAAHPAFLRWQGKPVVFFWRQERYPVEAWRRIRQEVDPDHASLWISEGVNAAYLEVFDGHHLYSVAWSAEPELQLVKWGQRVRMAAKQWGPRLWVATVMPGYDDRKTDRVDAFVRERENGAYYRRCWRGALESGADWVIITSWNEWVEGTYIEPSQRHGDAYLKLTAELSAAFKSARSEPHGPSSPVRVEPIRGQSGIGLNLVPTPPPSRSRPIHRHLR